MYGKSCLGHFFLIEHVYGNNIDGKICNGGLFYFFIECCRDRGECLADDNMYLVFVHHLPEPSNSNIRLGFISYTHLRAHETRHDLVCRLLLEKKKKIIK